MAKINEFPRLIALMEQGDFADELKRETEGLVSYLAEHSGQKGKAKGVLTIKLDFEVSGMNVQIIPGDVTVKKPARKRGATMLFCDLDGHLQTSHPEQDSLDLSASGRPARGDH